MQQSSHHVVDNTKLCTLEIPLNDIIIHKRLLFDAIEKNLIAQQLKE